MKRALILALALTGCESVPKHRIVKIESDPPGARIFFGTGPNEQAAEKGKSFLGVTPLEWDAEPFRDGDYFKAEGIFMYSSFVQPCAVFFAEPASTNSFTKKQVFHRPATFSAGNRIPSGIFFDLTKP